MAGQNAPSCSKGGKTALLLVHGNKKAGEIKAATGLPPAQAYIISPFTRSETSMEAEQINSIANRLADLSARSTGLRRYL
jgi:hypothetical protein